MNSAMMEMMTTVEGRYLTDEEVQRIHAYFEGFRSRVDAMRAIEAKEAAIVRDTIDEVWEKHPDFHTRHHAAREKAVRDVTLTLRYCAQAMVREDEEFLAEKLLFWLRTILRSFNMGQVIDTTYRTLARKAEAHLEPQHLELLGPYLRQTHRLLTLDR